MNSKHYSHLTPDERDQLAVCRARGMSLRAIARLLHRSPATLSRELRRNCPPIRKGYYRPHRAQARAQLRRSSASRRQRLRDPVIRRFVAAKLRLRWSPELIAGRLKLLYPGKHISHEAIYQWLYAEARQLIPCLPKRHRRRMRRGYVKGKHSRLRIPQRTPLALRPASVNARRVPGHWEVDTVGNHRSSRALLVIHERKTRFSLLRLLSKRGAAELRRSLLAACRRLPSSLRRSFTYDNGNENCDHLQINARLGTRSYFCAPYHSWEKGSIENNIGILRLRLPKSFNLDQLSHSQVRRLQHWLDNRPKKCLAFRTPAELYRPLRRCK